jgi:hypothetical protein
VSPPNLGGFVNDSGPPLSDARSTGSAVSTANWFVPHAGSDNVVGALWDEPVRSTPATGETFREEADRLERRLWGASGTKNRYQNRRSGGREAGPRVVRISQRSGAGVEPTEPWVTRSHRF